jgi:tetratricopeptide (TPR) repeat protein
MDQYASLLCAQGKLTEASKLADELIRICETRPEGWAAMSRFCEVKGEFDRAIICADKAIGLNKRHAQAYHVKGYMHI